MSDYEEARKRQLTRPNVPCPNPEAVLDEWIAVNDALGPEPVDRPRTRRRDERADDAALTSTLMHDQLDALEEYVVDFAERHSMRVPWLDDWIAETRKLLGHRGKRG